MPPPSSRALAQLTLLVVVGCGGDPAPAPAGQAGADRASPAAPVPRADAHGFNDQIAWTTLADGLATSARASRPLMLLVHASWCSKCKALKPTFQQAEVADLARRFVMVNVDQDKVPEALGYAPDGQYVPRILFISPVTGEVDGALRNPRRDRFRYFYSAQDDLAGTMKKALERYGSG